MDRQLRARLLLGEAEALGLSLTDLIAASRAQPARAPTLANFVDTIAATFTPGTAATYRSYWRLAVAYLGDRRLDDIGLLDLQAVVDAAVARARRSRPDSTERASRESCIAALRALFASAVAAGWCTTNPARALPKPRRGRSRRRALTDDEVAQLTNAVRTTSRDPDLDLLLVRFHLETGARRQGALNLRLQDIDPHRSTTWLREKDTEREQPTSPTLTALLHQHATSRGATHAQDSVFRRTNGAPMTRRRYNTIFNHAHECLPWADRTPVSAHVLRHTAITNIARHAGYPIAQTFAGHTPPTTTATYIHATLTEVATTIATLTGEPHPLATTPPTRPSTRCARPPSHAP